MDKEIDRKESHESKSILKFGEKRSNSVASLIPEENLFENLTKFGNDGFEPPIYQTDVKRFDTIGGGVPSKDSTDLTRNTANYTLQYQRWNSVTSKHKKFKSHRVKNTKVSASRIKLKRKFCRFISLVLIIMILLGATLVLYFKGSLIQRLSPDLQNKKIRLILENCRLHIDPSSDTGVRDIFVLDYRSGISSILENFLSSTNPFTFEDNGTEFVYRIIHYDDIRGCNLFFSPPTLLTMTELALECIGECTITQPKGAILATTFSITGTNTSVNLANLNVGNLAVKLTKGFFQVNNFRPMAGAFTRTIEVGEGDIVLETTDLIDVTYKSASENYCFGSKSSSVVVAPSQTNISATLSGYKSQLHKSTGKFEKEWNGQARLCNIAICAGVFNPVTINNMDGNIYINVLESLPSVVDISTYSIIKGSSYDKGVSIPIAAQVLANGYYNSTLFQSSPNLLMKFNIGNVKAYSSSGTHWVFNDHPLYSILKPWWISFFTLGKLVENTQTIPTYLSPGFCPYTQMIGKEEHLSISRAIHSFISSEKGELNFLMPTTSNIKATNKETSDGFIKLSTENNFSDIWVKVDLKNGDEYIYKQQFLTENYQIFLIMIISVVIPLLVSLKLTLFLIKLLFEGFKAIRIRAYHIELYWKIFSKVSNSNRKDTNGLNFEEEDNDLMMKRQSNEFNFNKNYSFIDLPSISNFIGFLLFELFSRSGGKSLQQFYALAFEEDKDSKMKEIEGQQPSKDKIPLKMFQGIYQQMCFLLNYRENDLTSTQSLEMLRERGMMLTTSETQVPYLIRLTLNMNTDLSLNYLKNNMKKSSLALFLDKFCSRTNFDEDKIPLETFTERYGLFCKLNHMEQVLIDHILLKNEYGIESRTFLKEIIEVDPDQVPLRNAQETINLGCFGRTMGWLHSLCHKKRFYNLQLERLKNINLFLAGKLNYSDVRKEEYQKIVESSILEKNWARIDFFSVVFELFIAGLLSFPFISIFIFQEIEHSIYSLREESRNIYGFNFQTNDIWLLFEKIFKNMTLMIVFILFLFFWFSTLINMVVNIVNYDFPWIKVFDPFKPSTKTIFKLLNAYQWVYMFISFWVLLFYICVVVVWDILACIINSQAYLATTAMGISLAYLISSFNVSYRKSISEGRVRFRNEYKEMWNLRLRLIVKKMIKFIKEAGGFVGREEGYNGAEITELSHLEDNVVSIEANLKKIAEEQPDTATFMNFFISLIHRDPKLRTHTEMYMMGPPMNFNYFTAQFLCNTLFMPKSFKIDKFGIEKNMNLCASVIFYYKDEIELVPLALKDIGELRVCDCPPDTPISTNYMCSNCSGRDSPYNNQEVKDSIRNRKISENSKIMVYMLDILSNLQKRRIPQVIKIIEKTFLEAYNEKIFFQIQPIFNMIHLLVFYLDENFDNSNLTSTVLDFLKNSLKVDMALTEILMIYLLKDSHMLENQKGDIYDSENISSIFKRQICSSSNNSKENKMLVKFLSISTSFLSSEPQISEDLIIEIAKDVNQNSSNVIMLPNVLFHNMIHFPLYMTQTQASISQKIAKHAFNSSITSEISGLMYHFTMVSTDLQYSRKEFENFLRKSPTFAQIKDHFGLSFKEMFGVIYLMRGDTNSEHFDKVLTNILKKYSLVGMKKHLDLLIILYSSYNPTKTKEALRIFAKWCTAGEEQFFILLKIFVYFKGIIKSDEKLLISFGDFFELLPSKKVENDPKLKAMFIDCIHQRNFSKFKNFKENILYVNKNKGSGKTKNEGELIPLIDIIELFFIISNGADINEMLAKLKSFIPDFESKNLLNFSSKLMKTVHGFKTSHKDILSERLKEAFKTLGEISMGRPNDFEQLWMFIYSSDHTGKLQAIKYFDKKPSQHSSVELEDNRLKSHSIFIDKRVRFIRNQNNFLDSFSEYCSNPSYKFGVAMLKRTHLKNLRLSKTQTTLILGSIIQKLDPSIKIENSSIARFFFAFFDFVIREDSTQLGNYFLEEHYEPMLNILTFCKNCPTPNERMNKIFEQLMANGHQKLCSLMYFYQLIMGQIHRRKITLKTELEREINQWLNIKPEFFEFLELYMDRDESNLVEMIFRIQNRILFNNPIKDKSSIQEGILTREFYETIQAVIKGEQPSIQFLADLFKIPLKKLKFLHILTTLKLNTKYENVFEQLNNNLEVKKLLEAQVVSSQELVFLLKICLNNIDYDSIADFLRLMKLDNIIVPEILINLLLLDVNVPKEFIPMRDFNQIFLVHSAIFERLGLVRELCWAFCRVLKGDFINFNKLINVFNDDNLPQNHKYFSKIITGMIGLKNYHFSDPKTMKALHTGGLPAYNNLLTDHFQRFSKGEKENSYEYAQYLLFNGFNIHPFWGLFCNLCKEQPNAPAIEAEPPKVGLFKNLTLMQLISITNILHCDEAVIEFLYDFSMFRNILSFLIEKRNAKERFLHSTLIDSYHEDMIKFYEERVNNCKQIMKEMIKDKRILFNYEHFKSIKSPLFQRMMIEICKNENLVQESDFYCPLNKLIFQHWKEELHSRMILATIDKEEKDWIHKLIDKIEDLLSDFKLMIKDPFKMFVTKENVTSKDYWDRKFEELDYFDNFLVSLVDLFMKSLDTMTPVLNQYGLTGTEFLVEEIALNLSMESEKSNKDPDLLDEDKKSASEVEVEDLGVKKGTTEEEDAFSEEDKDEEINLSVKWTGFALYVLLERLRAYIKLSSDEKAEKNNEILFKSNILFEVLEKALYFDRSGDSFRKYKYLQEFNFSSGIKMIDKTVVKYSASLFMPELYQYYKNLLQMPDKDMPENENIAFDLESSFSKCIILYKVHLNDEAYFKNKGIFAQYAYKNNDSNIVLSDGYINLAVFRSESNLIGSLKKLDLGEGNDELAKDYYTLQFIAKDIYKPVEGQPRLGLMTGLLKEFKQNERIDDPTLLSLALIEQGYYDFDSNKIDSLSDVYYSKKFQTTQEKRQKKAPAKRNNKNFKFLNDLALGKYTVLSETKNIFSEDIDLATYQKIYESILFLHNCKKTFSRNTMTVALKRLSPYLTSNIYNLNSILEFVISPNEDTDHEIINANLFKELGLKNQYFFHIFLMHTYSNERRLNIIGYIIEEIGIQDVSNIKAGIQQLINLCYLVKSDRESKLTRREFTEITSAILDQNIPLNVIDQLISVVYDQISSNDQTKNKNTDQEKIIDSIYEPFLSIAKSAGWDGQGFDYDKSVIVAFNKFLTEVHSNTKKAYLVKFENEVQIVHGILGLKNPPLMKVFDIAYWVTTSGSKNNSISDIDHILTLFFSAEGFKNSSSGSSVESEKLRQLLVFISSFYKNDIRGMLEFLKKYNMKEEFAFVLSYHSYIGLLTGHLTAKDHLLDFEELSLTITFVLFQQIYSSIALSPTAKFDESIINVLNVKHTEIVNEVYKIEKIDFVTDLKREATDRREPDHMVDVLMSGDIFKFLEGKINICLDKFLTFNEYPVLKNTLMRIKQLFLFNPRFYQNMNRDSNFKIGSLIDSAMNLRRIWNDTKRDFKNKKRDLLYFDAEEFIKKIMEPTKDSPDFSWMNVSEQDKKPLARTIFPTIMFSFIYLKTIRLHLKRNDNTQKLNLLKQSLNLIWRMCKEAKKDPLDDLKFKKSERVGFLNRYTALLYHLKVKKSNIMILKELLDFARSFIFVGGTNHYSTKLEDLIDSLKLDSFMELYDYLEESQNVKEITENHKENIINLFIQITSQCPKFQKHVTDIKYLVKLIQGDWSRLDYLIEKTFKRRENVIYAQNNLRNFIGLYNKINDMEDPNLASTEKNRERSIASIPKEDRDLILKRADEGNATSSDIYILLKGQNLRNKNIGFNDVELIFRRLSINMTEHRFSEILCATKLMRAQKSIGFANLNFSSMDEDDFESIFLYLEECITDYTKESLAMSFRNLIKHSLASIIIFLFTILVTSYIKIYFYGGGLIGSILCALIPICTMMMVVRYKNFSDIDKSNIRAEMEKAFEAITNSKPELRT